MANVLAKGTLLPTEVVEEMFNAVTGKSSLAKLSGQKPIPFNGTTEFVFSLDKEVDIVAENGAKSHGGITMSPITIIPVKFEYGARISDEFLYASEEQKVDYLTAFNDGFAKKLAAGLDLAAMHGVNPRTGNASALIGNNNFDAVAVAQSQVVTPTASANADVESAIALVTGHEHEVTGMAMSPGFRSSLASETRQDGTPLFPELGWGSQPDVIKGLPVDTNSTVSFNSSADKAVVGNFRDFFRWGVGKDITIEVIQYGNPDNSEDGDLKGHNQVYLRGEIYIGWGILVPNAFALISGEA
jgi:HK97 family phage major capsid protein